MSWIMPILALGSFLFCSAIGIVMLFTVDPATLVMFGLLVAFCAYKAWRWLSVKVPVSVATVMPDRGTPPVRTRASAYEVDEDEQDSLDD